MVKKQIKGLKRCFSVQGRIDITNQGIGDMSYAFNEFRANNLVHNLYVQDINLDSALNELKEVRSFIENPEHILGSMATKHGEIAEHLQVSFENADNVIKGSARSATFDNVGRTAPEDYLRNNLPVQSKFVQNGLSINAVMNHLKTYPDFLANGGTYDIPRDFYQQIRAWMALPPDTLAKLPVSEGGRVARSVIAKVKEFEVSNNVKFTDVVHPAQLSYDEVQLNRANATIEGKKQDIIKVDQAEREKYIQMSMPSIKEGLATAGISAAIDGVISFGTTLASKLNRTKKLSELDNNDWKDIITSTGVGVVRVSVTGGGIYALTNCAGMAAPLAASLVTATIGIVSQAILLGRRKISFDDFMYNILRLATDAAVSGLGAFLGQLVIPVPVVGAVVGSLVSTGILKFIRDKGFGGSYYQLLNKAENEAAYSANYKLLADTLQRCSQEFDRSIQAFEKSMRHTGQLLAQSSQNLNDIKQIIESI